MLGTLSGYNLSLDLATGFVSVWDCLWLVLVTSDFDPLRVFVDHPAYLTLG